jgi:hypothetical protein
MSPREAVGILREMADGGALDGEVVEVMVANREQATAVRRLAQEGASCRYREFLAHTPEAQFEHSAA